MNDKQGGTPEEVEVVPWSKIEELAGSDAVVRNVLESIRGGATREAALAEGLCGSRVEVESLKAELKKFLLAETPQQLHKRLGRDAGEPREIEVHEAVEDPGTLRRSSADTCDPCACVEPAPDFTGHCSCGGVLR